jgi:hypothetical protein
MNLFFQALAWSIDCFVAPSQLIFQVVLIISTTVYYFTAVPLTFRMAGGNGYFT